MCVKLDLETKSVNSLISKSMTFHAYERLNSSLTRFVKPTMKSTATTPTLNFYVRKIFSLL